MFSQLFKYVYVTPQWMRQHLPGKNMFGGMGADPSSDTSYCDRLFHYV